MVQSWLNMSSERVVVVVFSAPWSGATHILNTYLRAIAQEFPVIYTDYVDIEKSDQLANEFGIRRLPTVVILKNAEIQGYRAGTMPKKELRDWITSYL